MLDHFVMWNILSATTAPASTSALSGWVLMLIVIAVFAVPFTLGSLIAKWLKLKDMSFRMSVVLLALVLGLVPFAYQSLTGDAEARLYADQLSRWEEKGKKYNITEEGVGKLREALPSCEIRR